MQFQAREPIKFAIFPKEVKKYQAEMNMNNNLKLL